MNVLIVEDNEDVAFAIEKRLRSRGHRTELCTDGEDGYALAVTGDFDCVVLDINLPGQDGFQVLARLRGADIDTPTLILTARDDLGDKVDMLDLGADDYMVKPFALDELEARLRAISRRQNGQSRPILQAGRLRLDQAQRAVSIGGEPTDLGQRETQLLEYLLKEQGSTIRKETLVSKLFGYDEDGSPNAVELLISRLRRKLADAGVEILTQRGVGYQLRALAPQEPGE